MDLQSKNKILQNDSNALIQLKTSYSELVEEHNKVSISLSQQTEKATQLIQQLSTTTDQLEDHAKRCVNLTT